jgi:hypothetical protein
MLGWTKTRVRRQAYPGTGLVTSSAATMPRVASHCHRVDLVLRSSYMALLFLTSRVQALWFGYDGPDIAIIEPMVMSLQEVSRPTIVLSREKYVTWEKNSRTARSRVRHDTCSYYSIAGERRIEGKQAALCSRQANLDLRCLLQNISEECQC